MSTTLRSTFELDDIQACAIFGAARAVLEVDGVRMRGHQLLATLADALAVPDDAPAIDPADLYSAFPDARMRHALVDALLIPACIEGEVTRRTEDMLRNWARVLAVRSHWIDLLPAIRRRRVQRVKLRLARQSPDARRLLQRTWREGGFRGLWYALRFAFGRYQDRSLAARFRALADLPEGTVGRTFFQHITTNGLAFPGEPGGVPERMIHHDLMHTVNEYGTDPAGECELAGFYAGCTDGDAFTFIVIVLTTFHLGMPVSPAIVSPARGEFDPTRVLRAFLRGRQVRVDILGQWDYWELMNAPLAEARARIGIRL